MPNACAECRHCVVIDGKPYCEIHEKKVSLDGKCPEFDDR